MEGLTYDNVVDTVASLRFFLSERFLGSREIGAMPPKTLAFLVSSLFG